MASQHYDEDGTRLLPTRDDDENEEWDGEDKEEGAELLTSINCCH